jgi:ABC-type transport system involved in cytochrome c biogenesis permease component
MTFLPIVARELRVASRRKGTYRSRFWAALFAVGLLAFLLLVAGRGLTPERQAQDTFNVLAVLAFGYCILAGIFTTSDSISEEKREGTLGLLFLTDLRGYDVVMGKLSASSLNSLYGLFSIFPVLAIPLLLGGVSREQVGYTVLVLLNTLFFSLAAGIWVSSLCHNDRRAMGGTIFAIFLFSAGLPLLGVVWVNYAQNGVGSIPPGFYLPSPGFAFREALAIGQGAARVKPEYWISFAIVHGLGWFFLLLASSSLPRSWQDKPSGVRALRWRERWKLWSFGDADERHAFRTRLLNINAFYWLAGRNRLKPAHVWAFLGFIGVGWLWCYLKFHREWLDDINYIATSQVLHTVLKVWVAMEACRRLGEDHHNGALELILSTPLTVAEILHGQMQALYRQFFGPVLAILALDFIFLLVKVHTAEWVWWHLGNSAMFLFDLYALAWVAMWMGLVTRHVNRAPHAALLRVIILPVAAWLAFFIIIAVLDVGTGGREEEFILGSYLGFGFINSFFFYLWSRGRLFENLREVAAHRFEHQRAAYTTPAPSKPEPQPA